MKLYDLLKPLWVWLAVIGSAAHGDEKRPVFYPFKVMVGEQEAVVDPLNEFFAVVKDPVSADALVKIEAKAEMLIASAYLCQRDGTVLDDKEPFNIFAANSDQLALVATLKNEALQPGTYLMSVLAHGKSARLVFTIADPEGKMAFPKVSDVLKYIKGES